mmetsp:Transcript_17321/g.25970  ORF Transcript_17321/g.25970 Transcript_17321/m.25970 type:complete len:409 (-) Transcript_17321:22-1248(-)
MPWCVPSKIKADFSRVNPVVEKKSKIRRKFQDFASDVASLLARHEKLRETELFVLQQRKSRAKNKHDFRIVTKGKPVCCIALSYSQDEIMQYWSYCETEIPKKLPKTSKSKTLSRWIKSHFVMLALEQSKGAKNQASTSPAISGEQFPYNPHLPGLEGKMSPPKRLSLSEEAVSGVRKQFRPYRTTIRERPLSIPRFKTVYTRSVERISVDIVSRIHKNLNTLPIPIRGINTFLFVILNLILFVIIVRVLESVVIVGLILCLFLWTMYNLSHSVHLEASLPVNKVVTFLKSGNIVKISSESFLPKKKKIQKRSVARINLAKSMDSPPMNAVRHQRHLSGTIEPLPSPTSPEEPLVTLQINVLSKSEKGPLISLDVLVNGESSRSLGSIPTERTSYMLKQIGNEDFDDL